MELPGGARLLGVHGSPASVDEGIGFETPPDRLAELARLSRADLVVSGHTHLAFDAEAGGAAFHTLASVSNPKGADKSACYSILGATKEGRVFTRRSVPYDTSGVVLRARASGHPTLKSIERTFGSAGKVGT
jgi:predicted phosphodiesterase